MDGMTHEKLSTVARGGFSGMRVKGLIGATGEDGGRFGIHLM
jgi:hypothetical protein